MALKERLQEQLRLLKDERDERTQEIRELEQIIHGLGRDGSPVEQPAGKQTKKKAVRRTAVPSEERRSQLLAQLGNGAMTAAEAGKKVGLSPGAAREHLTAMIASGTVRWGPKQVNKTGRNSLTYERVPMAVAPPAFAQP